jgi:hypothetical protein
MLRTILEIALPKKYLVVFEFNKRNLDKAISLSYYHLPHIGAPQRKPRIENGSSSSVPPLKRNLPKMP